MMNNIINGELTIDEKLDYIVTFEAEGKKYSRKVIGKTFLGFTDWIINFKGQQICVDLSDSKNYKCKINLANVYGQL